METWNNQGKSVENSVIATAGLYEGFGAFSYSGGQILSPGSAPVYVNGAKSTTVMTNLSPSQNATWDSSVVTWDDPAFAWDASRGNAWGNLSKN